MLRLKSLPYLHRSLSPLRPVLSPPKPPLSISLPSSAPRLSLSSSTNTTMSTAAAIEHVVLFQVKPNTDPSLVDAMISNLRSLTSLDHVSYLTCGPILRHRSSAGSAFTHLLHSRYPSKPDLAAYSAHPSHVAVVKDFVLPICDDIMAVDWVADLEPGHVALRPGSAARLTFAKLKEGVGEVGKVEVMGVLGEIKGAVSGVRIEQVSCGENFSPARAKGYSIALMAVFDGVEELDGLEKAGEAVEKQKEKVRDYLDSVIVFDFVVAAAAPASL